MKVAQLYTYPVKSLAGFSLQTAELTRSGFQYDRQWMVVKPDGQFMTQRSHPQMALLQSRIEQGRLVLSSFAMEDYTVDNTDENNPQRLKTDVWGDSVNGIVHKSATSEWLSDALGENCKLLSFPQSEKRQCDLTLSAEGDHTLFADAFPILVISQESLDDLNDKLDSAVGMNRFRPNIVIQGGDPFAEDHWKNIEIGNIGLRGAGGCSRCSVPTVDPETGALTGPEPMHTLSTYRQKDDGEVYFGLNMIPQSSGSIRVGDAIRVFN